MKAIIKDNRTEAQKLTHTIGIVGTDPFLSRWGLAKDRTSYAAWACTPENWHKVERVVKARGDMLRVRTVTLADYRPSPDVHLRIYVAS